MPREHTWRYISMAAVFALAGMLIFWRAFFIQGSAEAAEFLQQSEYYSRLLKTIYPPRGEIYDRNGHLLAGNRTVYEIGVELESVQDPEAIAFALSNMVGTDYNSVLKKINDFSTLGAIYGILDDYVLPEKIDLLRAYNVNLPREEEDSYHCSNDPALIALICRPHLARSYPERDLASNVLGFVTQDSNGNFGVEQKYQDLLAGLPEEIWVPTDPNRVQELPDVPAGASLILTIDREIQAMVEDVLDEALERTGAESATGIVMDPRTGEILAMTSTPRLDLNDYQQYVDIYDENKPYNRATGQIYEPGSIFKVVTMAGAIDLGLVTPETVFNDTGIFYYGGIAIRNWNGQAWGEQTMLGCLQNSLNVCLASVGEKLGAENFYHYVQAFGFGYPTGVDLFNEASGTLRLPGVLGEVPWTDSDLATNTFGQGLAVTPMQMVTAVTAFINDGRMVIPHIVKGVVQNGMQYNIPPQFAGTPISAETAHTLTQILADSLEFESSMALVPGYRLAGKTGTAQIPMPSGNYDPNQTNTSFVGWGPVDDPKFVVFVWLERPETSIWASEVAAPVFADIVERLVVLMDIPPDQQRQVAAEQ
ncbi:MAG: penicillin-binding protein 2 [Chloroflexi bacterium]|nr:penicillin-binding protein 2 [Chloroflexota bacterium]